MAPCAADVIGLVPVAVVDLRAGFELRTEWCVIAADADPRRIRPAKPGSIAICDDDIERPARSIVSRDALFSVAFALCHPGSVVSGEILAVGGDFAAHVECVRVLVATFAHRHKLVLERRDLGALLGGVGVGTAEEEGEKEHGELRKVGGLERGEGEGVTKHVLPGTTYLSHFSQFCQSKTPPHQCWRGGVRFFAVISSSGTASDVPGSGGGTRRDPWRSWGACG